MSVQHAIDALTDEERRLMETIEADLDREMAVEPSPDFAAKVRARINAADRDRGWSFPWALAAAAVLMIAAGILFASWRGTPAGRDAPAIATGRDVVLPAPELSPSIVATIRPPDARVVRVPPTQAANAPVVEPEVLVPQDLRLAIGRVMEMVRAGTLKEQAFPAERAAATVEESAEPVAMVVEELQVPPINPADGGVEKGFGLY
jgi:hypothetical protein